MRVIIVGAGFAGISAVRRLLSAGSPNISVQLFEPNDYTTILPALPDYIGSDFDSSLIKIPISQLIPCGVCHIKNRVEAIYLKERKIISGADSYTYDYLVIAAGSTTNFFGFDRHLDLVYTLSSYNEAQRLKNAFEIYLETNKKPHVVIVGAGYTGIELAFNLIVRANETGKKIDVSLVETQDKIMAPLSVPQRSYVEKLLVRYGIKTYTGTRIVSFDGTTVSLATGELLDNVFLCWTAGTKMAVPSIVGKYDSLPDGRIKIGASLSIPEYPEVFVAGDCAAVAHKGNWLRKAVNFSIYSGITAATNVVNSIRNQPLVPFRPVDLGWILPLRVTSVGKLLGRIPVRGKIGMRMHYMMCGLRNYTLENKKAFLYKSLTFTQKE